MSYEEMQKRHQAEFDEFPLTWRIGTEGLEGLADAMNRLGLDESEIDKVCIGPCGCLLKKEDKPRLTEMLERQRKEMSDAIAADKTGNGFIYQMFLKELNNHEYGYTGDVEDTLETLGYDWSDVETNNALRHGLTKACEEIWRQAGMLSDWF